MASFKAIVVLLAIAGILSAHAQSPGKTVRIGRKRIKAQQMTTPGGWDKKIFDTMKPVAPDGTGDLDTQIVNGELVGSPSDYPGVVTLVRVEPATQAFALFCTGALIDNQLVLTAAHCMATADTANYQYAVCGGLVDLNSPDRICEFIETWWVPSKYNNDQFFLGYDLAVLKLQGNMLRDPIKRMKVSFAKPADRTKAVACGFGITQPGIGVDGLLRKTDVDVVLNDGQCPFLSAQGLMGDPQLICIDGFSDGSPSGICNGDSGSSLIVPGNGPDEQYTVGAASFGAVGCPADSNGVYASMYDPEHIEFMRAAAEAGGGSIQEPGGAPEPTEAPPAPTNPPTPAPTPKPECPPCTPPPNPWGWYRQQTGRGALVAACADLGDLSCLKQSDAFGAACCAKATAVLDCLVSVLGDAALEHSAISDALLTHVRQICA